MHALLAPLLLLAVLLPTQDEPAAEQTASPEAPLEEIEAALKERRSPKAEERAAADDRIVAAIDRLASDFESYADKDQKKVVSNLAKLFSVRTDEGEDKIFTAAAAALSEMGPNAEPVLVKAMKNKHLEDRLGVQEMLIESLGRHRNPKNVDLFVDLMKKDEDRIVVAAVKALGEYRDADAKIRKEIVEQLVKAYANAHALDTREKGKNPVFHERLLAIEVPMNESLAALTLQSFQSAPEWEKWFNDNRSKKW